MNKRSLIFFALLAGTFAPKAFCSKTLNALAEAKQARLQAEEARAQETSAAASGDSPSVSEGKRVSPHRASDGAQARRLDPKKSAVASASPVKRVGGPPAPPLPVGSPESLKAGSMLKGVPPAPPLPQETGTDKPMKLGGPPAPPLPVGSPESLKAGSMLKGVPPAPPLPQATRTDKPMKLGVPPAPPLPQETGTDKPMKLGGPSSSFSESDDDSGPENSVSSGSGEDVRREIASLARDIKRLQKQISQIIAGGGGAEAGGHAAAEGSAVRERPVLQDPRKNDALIAELKSKLVERATRLEELQKKGKEG